MAETIIKTIIAIVISFVVTVLIVKGAQYIKNHHNNK